MEEGNQLYQNRKYLQNQLIVGFGVFIGFIEKKYIEYHQMVLILIIYPHHHFFLVIVSA